jgi:hypothetical protein
MFILLTGDASGLHAEALRNYFSYRGTACITCDLETPVQQVHYAAKMALQPYRGDIDPAAEALENSKQSLAELRSWIEKVTPLHVIANAHIKKLVQTWDELKMYYVVIVHGNMNKLDMEAFPQSLKVLINNGEIPGSAGCSTVSSDCAGCDIFDLVVDTSVSKPNEAASTIGESLHSKIMSALDNSSRKASSNSASV